MYHPGYPNGGQNWDLRYNGYPPSGHHYGAPAVMPPPNGYVYPSTSNVHAPPTYGPTYVHFHHHYHPPQMVHGAPGVHGQQINYAPQPVHQGQIGYGAPPAQSGQSVQHGNTPAAGPSRSAAKRNKKKLRKAEDTIVNLRAELDYVRGQGSAVDPSNWTHSEQDLEDSWGAAEGTATMEFDYSNSEHDVHTLPSTPEPEYADLDEADDWGVELVSRNDNESSSYPENATAPQPLTNLSRTGARMRRSRPWPRRDMPAPSQTPVYRDCDSMRKAGRNMLLNGA